MKDIRPEYYKLYPFETIDIMISIFGYKDVATFCLINAMKYRLRMGYKKGNTDSIEEDLKKESWYLKKYRELSAPTEE